LTTHSKSKPTLKQLTERIVLAFLRLYRVQMDTTDPELASAKLVSPSSSAAPGAAVYDLQVKHADGVYSRRMSIEPVGEEIHSKSRCFRVIYDDRLVVKIHPRPITDFEKYLDLIAVEKRIAEKLSPDLVCIIPGFGVMFDKIPGVSQPAMLSDTRREELLSHRFKSDIELQQYLKVGSTLAFFSALADHRFLNEVIADIHNSELELPCEIQNSLGALWHHGELESCYNTETVTAIFDVDKVFRQFERQLRFLAKSLHLSRPLDAHWRQTVFTRLISGPDLSAEPAPLEPDLVECVHQIWDPIYKKTITRSTLENFKACLKQRIEANKYHRCRSFMSSLGHQLLVLLNKLNEKQVAMRDLKPDNIFTLKVSNLPEGVYSTPAIDALGLIDLETAVRLKPEKGNALRQPLLSGSPAYATPANLFENHILKILFPDLPGILLLQDWYAAIGVMYKIIIGKVLFWQTGRTLPKILQIRNSAPSSGKAAAMAFRKASEVFWHSVISEFRVRVDQAREPLETVYIDVPPATREFITQSLRAELDSRNPCSAKSTETNRKRQVHFQWLKTQLNTVNQRMSGLLLLRVMLAVVYSKMYPRRWETPSSPKIWRT